VAPSPTREAARGAPPAEHLFYDGDCGLCHRVVLFSLRRERGRALFRFAPLAGPTFAALVPEATRRTLPDSFVLRTADGRLLLRSDAALHLLRRIGGGWGLLAGLLGLVPRALRDLVYDGVARVRRRLFAPPPAACPLVPAELAARFDP